MRKIEGEVNSDGNLTVGENARVKGEIKTKSVTVFGKAEGNITVTDRCELKSNAELHGDISAGTLAIEEGARVQWACSSRCRCTWLFRERNQATASGNPSAAGANRQPLIIRG